MKHGSLDTALIVVGSGVAGLYAALSAASRGMKITLLTKDSLENSNSWYAQGGLTAVGPAGIERGDSVASHIADTLVAGARLNDVTAVRSMCESAWDHVEALVETGTEFDRDSSGEFALGLEAAHAHARILHAGGDATGKVIASALIGACLKQEAAGNLTIREHTFVTELVQDHAGEPERVTGVRVLNADGSTHEMHADAVLLATGGLGNLYAATTNPYGATGDGAALAYRAGAVLVDSEFIQFHPTLVSPGGFMVSEAVRGEGAVLINRQGNRFMQEIHPDAELAPRDVVARAIHEINASGDQAFLDATNVEAQHGVGFLAQRFPSITRSLAELGYDLGSAAVPVTEAAHYWMGGVATNAKGETTLPGLYAAGETACTGVHGANRLASNSLLEALTFAWNVVNSLRTQTSDTSNEAVDMRDAESNSALTSVIMTQPGTTTPVNPSLELDLQTLQDLANTHLGVQRTGEGLYAALTTLESCTVRGDDRPAHELRNLHTLAKVIACAALNRENSIGAHYRADATQAPALIDGTLQRFGFKLAKPVQSGHLERTKTTGLASSHHLQTSNIG